MPIFDDIERTLQGGRRLPMSCYEYLNRSARPGAAAVRGLLNNYFSNYPLDHQDRLRTRLGDFDDTKHNSAFFELATHELLRSNGIRIVELEPSIPGSTRRPDFLIETQAGQSVYVEATIATGQTQKGLGAQSRFDDAVGAIDNIDSPDFILAVHWTGSPAHPVRLRRLREQVELWIASLDYDDVRQLYEKEAKLPEFVIEDRGLKFRIEAVPRTKSRGDRDRRAIGYLGSDVAAEVTPHVALRETIKAKAGRYGDLGRPYVIAVNEMSEFGNFDSQIAALFGSEMLAGVRRADGQIEYRETRSPDGVWNGRSSPSYTRVSAVLVTERVTPWSIGQRRARLFLNPWAQHPLPDLGISLDKTVVEGELITSTEGESLGEILKLPPEWPGD